MVKRRGFFIRIEKNEIPRLRQTLFIKILQDRRIHFSRSGAFDKYLYYSKRTSKSVLWEKKNRSSQLKGRDRWKRIDSWSKFVILCTSYIRSAHFVYKCTKVHRNPWHRYFKNQNWPDENSEKYKIVWKYFTVKTFKLI